MQERIKKIVRKIKWQHILLVLFLLLLEISITPLGPGPDRRIHDPAVNRIAEATYLQNDWYTNMASESGVYVFYAQLIHFGKLFNFNENAWRLFLFVVGLVVLYYALFCIARLFSKSPAVIPLVAVFHAILVLFFRPVWLYGPFIQVDGGLAPRTIGVSLSFLALYFLLKNARVLPWVILGAATLIHVSNSLVIFTLFLGISILSWIMWPEIQAKSRKTIGFAREIIVRAGVAVVAYIAAGGWFALKIANLSAAVPSNFSAEKFIWAWTYFRAPYMALLTISVKMWLLFGVHVLVMIALWYVLSRWKFVKDPQHLRLLGLLGAGSIVYFFLFYLFSFIYPWLPGFQFYSIRTIYILHFVTYLFGALFVIALYIRWKDQRISAPKFSRTQMLTVIIVFVVALLFFSTTPGSNLLVRMRENLRSSWNYVRGENTILIQDDVKGYLALHPEPFLAPPDFWYTSAYYLPNIASFKNFGFTRSGLEEWYKRMNDVSQGRLEGIYASQLESGMFSPAVANWVPIYSDLSVEEVVTLSTKYDFEIFVTYRNLRYPFQLVKEDSEYRLYKIVKS